MEYHYSDEPLYTGELNVADTLSVGDYTSYNSYKDLRKYGFAPYYEVAKKAGEDKGNYFTVEMVLSKRMDKFLL